MVFIIYFHLNILILFKNPDFCSLQHGGSFFIAAECAAYDQLSEPLPIIFALVWWV